MHRLPLQHIETVFFDVGNTLISMDHAWIARELVARGCACDPRRVARAEAAARPRLGAALADRTPRAGEGERTYLGLILEGCTDLPAPEREALVPELGRALEWPGRAWKLWSQALPGVERALDLLQRSGLRLAAVSNSDGTVERSLERSGLRPFFHAVLDSHRVGSEKPDPRIFEAALEACDAVPERTLHVGDLYETDVRGARGLGIHAVLIDPHGEWGALDCPVAEDVAAVSRALLAAR